MIYKFKKWVILPAFTEVIISAENDQEALRMKANHKEITHVAFA